MTDVDKYWKQFVKAVDARKQEERLVLLLALLLVLGYAGFILLIEPLQLQRADLDRRLTVTNTQIIDESNRQAEIRTTYTSDPDTFARTRQSELQAAIVAANTELEEVYGQLIDPREMSLMLTRILQSESSLALVSLSNKPSELLLTTDINDETDRDRATKVELFRHGMQMVFEGSYLDTVRYLQSLEALENNFFWESMQYDVQDYPKARITLDIYTLSTQRGWIGV